MDKRTELALKLYDLIFDVLDKEIENVSEDLLADDEDNKYNCHEDRDYIDGMCVRCDEVYDEEKVYEDALKEVIENLDQCDCAWEKICNNPDFIGIIKEIARSM